MRRGGLVVVWQRKCRLAPLCARRDAGPAVDHAAAPSTVPGSINWITSGDQIGSRSSRRRSLAAAWARFLVDTGVDAAAIDEATTERAFRAGFAAVLAQSGPAA